jgi:hypothetical protein
MSWKNASMDCMYGRDDDFNTNKKFQTINVLDPYRSISQVQILMDLDLGCGVDHDSPA